MSKQEVVIKRENWRLIRKPMRGYRVQWKIHQTWKAWSGLPWILDYETAMTQFTSLFS